jgi:hypothetical protein
MAQGAPVRSPLSPRKLTLGSHTLEQGAPAPLGRTRWSTHAGSLIATRAGFLRCRGRLPPTSCSVSVLCHLASRSLWAELGRAASRRAPGRQNRKATVQISGARVHAVPTRERGKAPCRALCRAGAPRATVCPPTVSRQQSHEGHRYVADRFSQQWKVRWYANHYANRYANLGGRA